METAIQAYTYEDLVGIRICPTDAVAQRQFHIAFLLDTSGSMEGERLATVKRTLHLFMDEMGETDRVTLISYSSDAKLLCTAESDTGRLRTVVDGLQADGGTNMEAALCKLAEIPDLAQVDAVFFLTDGEVNQGICSVEGLRSIAVNVAFGTHKIPVYTLGYGATHDAKLLQAIALATRSSYTYAETSEMIPSIVGTILAAMREEVAKGVELEWRGAECWEHGAEGERYCVGSVVLNKPQWIVLKGAAEGLRVRWRGNEEGVGVVVGDESLDVLEQAFRVRSVKLFADTQNPFLVGKLQRMEEEIANSPVANRPLMLRIRAEIAEQIAFWDRCLAGVPNVGYQQHVTRLVSHATAFANQRGDDIFASPTQRQVSGAMVHHFSQDPTGLTHAASEIDPDSQP